jgi:hypothetical protein
MMLEGVSEAAKMEGEKKSFMERLLSDKGVDQGLLIVDLLSLPKKFSWKRYRIDILGYLAAGIIVIFLIVLMLFLAQVGS